MSTPILRVDSLRVEVESTGDDIVDDVTFAIEAGEVLALVGESGSGKTTVGLAVLGHSRRGAVIAGGRIELDGKNILDMQSRVLRGLRGGAVAYIPQDPASALNPALRVGRQLEEALATHAPQVDRSKRIAEVLAEVALPADRSFLRRYPHQLSGGQQQRIALAIAFVCRPRVIVLDEPTTGLDVTTQAHVLETVKELCEAHGVAALYVSHDLAVVANLSQRVAVMYAGRLVELGNRYTLFQSPRHPYTQRLIAAIPAVADHWPLIGIPGSAPRPGDRPPGCFFAPRCAFAIDICHHRFPEATAPEPRHSVRCHRWSDLPATADGLEHTGRGSNPNASGRLVSINRLDAAHGDHQVLFDIELAIEGHRCVALVGESGSGKTTLARCVAGLHRQWTGEIQVRGEQLPVSARDRSPELRREIQYVFQNPYNSLNPRKTVAELIGQPLRLFFSTNRRQTHDRAVEALRHVQLTPSVLDRLPHELSGGERQRVAIARALAAQPALLICDEVTSALDVSVQAGIVELIDGLRRELGVGVLFVTHNLALIRTIAQDVAVMSAGRIVESGAVDRVLTAPEADYTRRLLADTPSLDLQYV